MTVLKSQWELSKNGTYASSSVTWLFETVVNEAQTSAILNIAIFFLLANTNNALSFSFNSQWNWRRLGPPLKCPLVLSTFLSKQNDVGKT